MAQKRYWNWKDDDSTNAMNQRDLFIIPFGRYSGFKPVTPFPNSLVLSLEHTADNVKKVKQDLTDTPALGIWKSKQGVLVEEDAAINLTIAAGDATYPRIDLIVGRHKYVAVTGGTVATYSVVQGTPSATPVAPALPFPNEQVILGTLYVGANVTALNNAGVIYTPSPRPNFSTDQFVMKLNEVQTSTAEKTFNLYGGTIKELVYDDTTDPLNPILTVASSDDIANMWIAPPIGGSPLPMKGLFLTSGRATDPSANKQGRIHKILFAQSYDIESNFGNLIPAEGTLNGSNTIRVNGGDTITILDGTDLGFFPPSVPIYIILDGIGVGIRREAKFWKPQWWHKQNWFGNITGGVFTVDDGGNYVELDFPNSGGNIEYISDISARADGMSAPSGEGGAILIVRIKQDTGSGNIILKHNMPQIYTHKPVFIDNYGADVTLENGNLLLLIEDATVWRVLAIFNDGNPFVFKNFAALQNTQNTTVNTFMQNYTPETFKKIGGAGNMANGQPIPAFTFSNANKGGTAQELRLRKVNPSYVHLQGVVVTSGLSWGTPFSFIMVLPIGYRPLADMEYSVLRTDSSGVVYTGILLISTSGIVAITFSNLPSGTTGLNVEYGIDLMIPID